MKLFLVHTMESVGSIWKSKSGWSLGLSVATEVLLTAARSITMISNPSFVQNQPRMTPQSQWNSSLSIKWCLLDPYGRVRVVGSCLLCPWGCQWPQKFCWLLGDGVHHYDFQPKFCWKSTLHDTTEPMELFLVHTMVFVGSIWKSKSGWFLVPGAVSGHRSFADCWVMGSITMISNPSFVQNQPHMTPQVQWKSSLSTQWCFLDPYGRVRVVVQKSTIEMVL
jgi:hypothetical protein